MDERDEELKRLRAEVAQLRNRTGDAEVLTARDEISAALAAEISRVWPADLPREHVDISSDHDVYEDSYSWRVKVASFALPETGVVIGDFHAGFTFAVLRGWRTPTGKEHILDTIARCAAKVVKHVRKYS